jgi:hypothetical protein
MSDVMGKYRIFFYGAMFRLLKMLINTISSLAIFLQIQD